MAALLTDLSGAEQCLAPKPECLYICFRIPNQWESLCCNVFIGKLPCYLCFALRRLDEDYIADFDKLWRLHPSYLKLPNFRNKLFPILSVCAAKALQESFSCLPSEQ